MDFFKIVISNNQTTKMSSEMQELNQMYMADITRKWKQITDDPMSDEVNDRLTTIKHWIKEWKQERKDLEEAEAKQKAKEAEERLEQFWALEEAGQFESYICGSCSEELTPHEFYKGKMCCDNPLFGYDEKEEAEEECIHDSRKRLRLNGPIGDGCGLHCLSHLDWDESWECECCACEGIYWRYE